jgi:hypothetical protein
MSEASPAVPSLAHTPRDHAAELGIAKGSLPPTQRSDLAELARAEALLTRALESMFDLTNLLAVKEWAQGGPSVATPESNANAGRILADHGVIVGSPPAGHPPWDGCVAAALELERRVLTHAARVFGDPEAQRRLLFIQKSRELQAARQAGL